MLFEVKIDYKAGIHLSHVDMLSRFSQNVESETVFKVTNDRIEISFSCNLIISQIQEFGTTDECYNRIKSRIIDTQLS